jgi:hypothetical protein
MDLKKLMRLAGDLDKRANKSLFSFCSHEPKLRLLGKNQQTEKGGTENTVSPFLSTPSMGVISTVKVRNGGWQAPTISQGQGCPPRGGI